MTGFREFLEHRLAEGGFPTEDALAFLLPLMKQVADTHRQGLVVPLSDLDRLQVADGKVFFAEDDALPLRQQLAVVREIQQADRGPVEIISRPLDELVRDVPLVDEAATKGPSAGPTHPVFVPGYLCWEQLAGHHDPLTDVFNLGQILATLALGLDFRKLADVRRFAKHRRNPFAIQPAVHPVLARAIVRMTELHRDRRVQELPLLIRALENYRQQEVEVSVEPDQIPGFESRDLQGKQQLLLDRLQKRLFEISRRNRMLHFRATSRSINLTEASIPLSVDYRNIPADRLLTCRRDVEERIAEGQSISLNRYLNFTEAIYLPSRLNLILRESRRDLAEYGFEQLRLVLCMLHWSNLKEEPHERFSSPLVLVPVKLKKKRGVRDTWTLQPLSNDAEINPVVRYLFRQIYNIQLPERIDLETTGCDSLYEFISEAIARSEPAVELLKVDRPPIRLLHRDARQRLEQYRKRARLSGRGVRSFRGLDYSYDPATWLPLGIRLFTEYLTPRPGNAAVIVPSGFAVPGAEGSSRSGSGVNQEADDADDAPEEGQRDVTQPTEPAGESPPTANRGRDITSVRLAADRESNPWNWTFDLCSVTLANFHYRKMSLVRDYESLLAETPHSPPFESAFSLVPRPADRSATDPLPFGDRYEVVSCDPTQADSIAEARKGDSYIIEGPPGTGKSQTITNLIADYAARGKRVLFVCEKRAAIDVVFARLRQCGLADLGCLIHDSQADKKAFVMDLKQTYETFLQQHSRRDETGTERTRRVSQLRASLQPLKALTHRMNETDRRAGVPTRQLVEHCVTTQPGLPRLDDREKECLPWFRQWMAGQAEIEAAVQILEEQVPGGILARHPLRHLRSSLADVPDALKTVTQGIADSHAWLQQLADDFRSLPFSCRGLNLQQLQQLADHARSLMPLARLDALALLQSQGEIRARFDEQLELLTRDEALLAEAREANSGWRNRIDRRDLPACIETANALSRKMIPILYPAWWRLRKVLNRGYDFDRHPVKPSWVAVLTALQTEYRAADAVQRRQQGIGQQFGLGEETGRLIDQIGSIRDQLGGHPQWLQQIHEGLVHGRESQQYVQRVAAWHDQLQHLRQTLDGFLDESGSLTAADLQKELDTIDGSMELLPDYLAGLDRLRRIPDETFRALRQLDLPARQIGAASAAHTLQSIERDYPDFRRFSQATRRTLVRRVDEVHRQWMEINAEFLRQQVQGRFLDHVFQTSASGVSDGTDEEFRTGYQAGRKILEHEFGKQMRYKSIRELVTGDSGRVVRDLKPIWLMSPLSVSDTLPLGVAEFDVVIFDEASQITLESAVPALFRARQAIVVGDEQQLPPTDFFSARLEREEDETIAFEHEGETVIYDLESNSLLNHAARNLPSTMLGWHYRSRNEALISFSNQAFYNGRLLTIPEETLLAGGNSELAADSAAAAEANATALQDRPVSFHIMNHGIYLQRRNRPEAEYIAALIREHLRHGDGRTLGVIAFSEAQEDEIEDAVDRLAAGDREFGRLLEAELAREDGGQVAGLLIKNLENIQGDERDIVILSVCYGPDNTGRMIMNFGPINKTGGEKRLNVAFSRAKHHMAIVSSIRHAAITNQYNVGANCLRNYLRYAQAISQGDPAAAETVLHELSPWRDAVADDRTPRPALQLIAERLAEHGLTVDFNIGHSGFRCDMGLRRDGDRRYRLGVLVDAGDYYASETPLIDRELFRPGLLRIFGWDVYRLMLKDWLRDADQLVEEMVALCADPSAARHGNGKNGLAP
jgi:hypothetical protein